MALSIGSDRDTFAQLARAATLTLTASAAAVLAVAGVAQVTTAQPDCRADVEPNDTEADVTMFGGPLCIDGSLPDGDQDLLVWELTSDSALTRWAFDLEGVPGTQTLLEVFVVSEDSGPDQVRVEGRPIIELSTQPAGPNTARRDDVILRPGRYLVAAARSPVPGGGDPVTIDYSIRIEQAYEWPVDADVEPNDTIETAQPLVGAFEIAGDRAGTMRDTYAWTVEQPSLWDVRMAAPIGATVWIDLLGPDGSRIDSLTGMSDARFYDLSLEPGTYGFEIRETGEGPEPYILSAIPAAGSGDPEPNDTSAAAVPLADGMPQRGRLGKTADRDRFRLDVPPGQPALRDIRMLWRSGAIRKLCLLDASDSQIVCQDGDAGLSLPNLLLAPGAHTFEVSGTPDPDDTYMLRVDVTAASTAAFEAEPNQDVETATPIDPALGMNGRGGPRDDDIFRLHVDGEPQLWRIDIEGSDLARTELLRARGRPIASGVISGDGSSATLEDLYLVPGDHWLRVNASGPEYSITTTPLGPPDPDRELEPNDEASLAQAYRIGERRIGRLPNTSDADLYRFTLPEAGHLRLDVTPPDDASIDVAIESLGTPVADYQASLPGSAMSYDLWLEAGDHIVELRADPPSGGTYELTSTRLDPFDERADREPNDSSAWASEAPVGLAWSGDALLAGDEDWYRLPAMSADALPTIIVEGAVERAWTAVSDEAGSLLRTDLGQMEDGSWTTLAEPAVDALEWVAVRASGPYSVRVVLPGEAPTTVADDHDVDLVWELPISEVAAYWPDEQVIEGTLVIMNRGPSTIDLELDIATSHHQWRASVPTGTLVLAAGESQMVPVTIAVGADTWGTDDVLVSARARLEDGSSTWASTTVATSPKASPVAPRTGWSVPDQLLGGLNAGSVHLGAVPGGTLDPDRERKLFDGVTPEGSTAFADQTTGNGFGVFVSDHVEGLPIEVDVDLAGDDPIPVVGTIINPQSSEGELRETPREFELLLSTDGETWTSVLDGTLTPQRIDQSFVLDEPVDATHARLRIRSKYVDPGAYLSIGEWKIIAAPGVGFGDEAPNIGDPTLGGHVVTLRPFVADPDVLSSILDAEATREVLDLSGGRTFEVVIGFRDGRAARLSGLEWLRPDGSVDTEMPARVEVAASTQGPTGPWVFLDTWELAPAADGSIELLAFEAEPWVRYLRLRGRAPFDAASLELPAAVRVLELATGPGYRSILGEWGYRSRVGPLEWLAPGDPFAPVMGGDAADTRTDATPLDEGIVATDRVEIDVDEDWFRVHVPDERNTLEIVVDGRPTVAVALELFEDDGERWPMTFSTAADGTVRYHAEVEADRSYDLRVVQPVFSAVFAFDTSPSIDPFLDMVTQGMREFLADVRPGREAITVVPFEEPALLPDWEDDPHVLQGAFENHVPQGSGSSGAEAALVDASNRLANREGARAVLLVTDGETSTFEQTPELWQTLGTIRPTIFSVHIGALVEPLASRQRMQDWAAAGGGHYSYPTTHGEMGRVFERMATWLRRPAAYTLTYETMDIRPAQLAVVPASDGSGAGPATLAPGLGIEIILDTSGSMRKKLKGKRRIDIAKASLRTLISESLAEDVPVALRTFGMTGSGRAAKCGTTLDLPLTPLDRASALKTVKKLTARKKTATPIAAALEAVGRDLAAVDGLRSVILITDGEATCDGDPGEAIEALAAQGVDVKLDIIGFALDDSAVKEQMAAWASSGGGAYYDAESGSELAAKIVTAVSAPFRVYGPDGEPLASGTVGGAPVEIDPGDYRVEVLSDPPLAFDDVEIPSGGSVILELIVE